MQQPWRGGNGAELIIVSDVPRNSDFLSFDVEEGQGMGDGGRLARGVGDQIARSKGVRMDRRLDGERERERDRSMDRGR